MLCQNKFGLTGNSIFIGVLLHPEMLHFELLYFFYDSLTQHLTLFKFALLVNKCKPVFRFKKTSKDAKILQKMLTSVDPICYKQNRCAEGTVTYIFNLEYEVEQ